VTVPGSKEASDPAGTTVLAWLSPPGLAGHRKEKASHRNSASAASPSAVHRMFRKLRRETPAGVSFCFLAFGVWMVLILKGSRLRVRGSEFGVQEIREDRRHNSRPLPHRRIGPAAIRFPQLILS
jgi:hypothetical protein